MLLQSYCAGNSINLILDTVEAMPSQEDLESAIERAKGAIKDSQAGTGKVDVEKLMAEIEEVTKDNTSLACALTLTLPCARDRICSLHLHGSLRAPAMCYNMCGVLRVCFLSCAVRVA